MKTISSKSYNKGDVQSRKNATIGPFKVFLDSDNRNPDNSLIMEEYTEDGEIKKRPQREEESFLDQVFFKKNHFTIGFQEELAQRKQSFVEKGLSLHGLALQLSYIVYSWDLTDNGEPIPPTFEGIIGCKDLDGETLMAVMNCYNEVTRLPKELSGK